MAAFRKQRSLIVFIILIIVIILYSVQYISFNNHSYEKSDPSKSSSENQRFPYGESTSDDFSRVQFIHNPNLKTHQISLPQEEPVVIKNIPNYQYPLNHGSSFIKRLHVTEDNYYAPVLKNQQQTIAGAVNKANYEIANTQNPHVNSIYVPPKRIVHFDLKGAPPKVEYLHKIFKLISDAGATGILLEWEDMLPFHGPLVSIKAKNSYSKNDVNQILQSASDNNLEIIPLVQTFGHLEFALKTEQWKHLREVDDVPQAVCPSRNETISFLQNMIDQVMDLHSGAEINYLHIGCDEVYQLGMCEQCRKMVRDTLFLDHTVAIAKYVKTKYNVQPLIWHDMMVHIPASVLINIEFSRWVEPVVWVYAEDVYRFASVDMWKKLEAVFPTYWGASAFKGAFGETLNLPPIQRHLDNNLEWLRVMKTENINFRSPAQGLILTGWQRYDHFAVLCELFPASIPSLIINLLTTSHGYLDSRLQDKFANLMTCPSKNMDMYLGSDPYLEDFLRYCKFPGVEFFKLVGKLENAQKMYKDFISTQIDAKGWLTDYSRNHNFSSSLRTDEIMADFPVVYSYLSNFIEDVPKSLDNIFDNYTIIEWLEQRTYSMIKKLDEIQRSVENLKTIKVWDVRPYSALPDFLKYYMNAAKRG